MDWEIKLFTTSNNYAVSEVIGSVLLLLIALLAFSAIYTYVFPLPLPEDEPHVKIVGYVDDNGTVVLEHVGGETLESYRIVVFSQNGSLLNSMEYDQPWSIGDTVIPTTMVLPSENDSVEVMIYTTMRDGSEELVFDGILQGKTRESDSLDSTINAYLISSLLTDTTEEDLICFNTTQNGTPIVNSFSASTYIYRWMINNQAIANLLMPFAINSTATVEDYSGNNYHGTIYNATWISNGVADGAYSFNSNSYMIIPYCFSEQYIGDFTIEVWVKTVEHSGVILSFNRSNYFELSIINDHVRWSTTANSITTDITGSRVVTDGNWHLITVTYNSNNGRASIYVDGILDTSQVVHNANEHLGSHAITYGYLGKMLGNPPVSGNITVFSDNFEADKGWSVENSPTLSDGSWERGIPVDSGRGDPPNDYDGSGNCYLTDNQPGNSDVDNGLTYLISPTINLEGYSSAIVNYAVWYTNNFGSNPNSDYFHVYISDDNGTTWHLVETIGPNTPMPWRWINYSFHIEDFVNLTSNVRIRFEVSDLGRPSIVEAGVDSIEIIGVLPYVQPIFNGMIDELRIYNRVLSSEQIYQDFLLMNSGDTSISVIVSDETLLGETWKCIVIPANSNGDSSPIYSNQITIINYGGG